jgi:hypothetical protein
VLFAAGLPGGIDLFEPLSRVGYNPYNSYERTDQVTVRPEDEAGVTIIVRAALDVV